MAATKDKTLVQPIYLPDTLSVDDIIKDDKLMKWLRSLKDIQKMIANKVDITPIYQAILPDALAMAQEHDFLLQLCENLESSSWPADKKWIKSKGHCSWAGLTFKENRSHGAITARRITVINLSRYNLFGNETVGRNGNIPDTIGCLTKLRELNLCYNYITGPIPPSIVKLSELKKVRLEFNHLKGGLPQKMEGLKSLEYLAIDHNKIEGRIDELAKLTKLKELYIHENFLSGNVPEAMLNIAGLKRFYFYGNKFASLAADSRIKKERVNSKNYDWRDVE